MAVVEFSEETKRVTAIMLKLISIAAVSFLLLLMFIGATSDPVSPSRAITRGYTSLSGKGAIEDIWAAWFGASDRSDAVDNRHLVACGYHGGGSRFIVFHDGSMLTDQEEPEHVDVWWVGICLDHRVHPSDY